MSVIFVMLPVAMALAVLALAAFFWAAHRGQFDDLETPAYRVLFDDQPIATPPTPLGSDRLPHRTAVGPPAERFTDRGV